MKSIKKETISNHTIKSSRVLICNSRSNTVEAKRHILVSYVGERLWLPIQSPKKGRTCKANRSERERDEIELIDFLFEREQFAGFRKARRQDVP